MKFTLSTLALLTVMVLASTALHDSPPRTGYTYASFGGVLYLFVRGIAPAHDRGTGVYFERPSEALVEALDDAVAGRSPQAGPGGAR